MERTQRTSPDQICRGYPKEFRDYFAHCESLEFEDRPDYEYLKRIFKGLFEYFGYEDDGVFDWNVASKQNDIAAEAVDASKSILLVDACEVLMRRYFNILLH